MKGVLKNMGTRVWVQSLARWALQGWLILPPAVMLTLLSLALQREGDWNSSLPVPGFGHV